MITAKLRYLRISPRKVRMVVDLIRKKTVDEARDILNFTRKKASAPLSKLLKQAIDNAKNNFQINSDNLFISKIRVDEGPKYKRWFPRARGRADQIQKKTSHITLVLDEVIKKRKKIKAKAVKKEAGKIDVSSSPADLKIKDKKSEEKTIKDKKFKFKPEVEFKKPKVEKGGQKIFRRKSF